MSNAEVVNVKVIVVMNVLMLSERWDVLSIYSAEEFEKIVRKSTEDDHIVLSAKILETDHFQVNPLGVA